MNIPLIKFAETACKKLRKDRYASFDGGKEKKYEDGKLSLEHLGIMPSKKGRLE